MLTTKSGHAGIWVLWKDHVIEHLNDYNAWTIELRALLEKRCRHLEDLGVEVNGNSVVWHWDWFRHCPFESPYLPLLRLTPGVYAHGRTEDDADMLKACHVPPGRICEPDGSVIFVSGKTAVLWKPAGSDGGGGATKVDMMPDNLGGWYHPLAEINYHTAWMGQKPFLGTCYATYHNVFAYLKRLHWGIKAEDFVKQVVISF